MSTMTETVANNLKRDLVSSLTLLSNGKLNVDLARKIAEKSINKIDLNNSALVHKGTNWYAREILSSIKL